MQKEKEKEIDYDKLFQDIFREPVPESKPETDLMDEINSAIGQRTHSGDYRSLAHAVEKLNMTHAEINRYLKREQSSAFRYYTDIKDYMEEKVTGKRRVNHTLEELFDRELDTIHEMNRYLSRLLTESRKKLENIDEYTSRVDSQLSSAIASHRDKVTLTKTLIERINTTREQSKDMRKDNPDYITVRQGYRSLVSELRMMRNEIVREEQRIKFRAGERVLLERYETLLWHGMDFCERISDSVGMIAEHVTNTKDIFLQFQQNILTANELVSAVESLGGYIRDVNEAVAFGCAELSGIIYQNKSNDMLSNLSEMLDEYLSEISLMDTSNGRHLNDEIEDIINERGI